MSPEPAPGALREVAALFLRLGVTAFGGPAAHVALMEDEVVRRRRWLSREEFLDLVGATNLIPGPNSTELAIHLGHRRAGWPGLVVAGVCFIAPALCIVLGLAWAYVRYGSLPQLGFVLAGIKPVLIAVVLQALVGLGRSALKNLGLAALGIAAVVATLLGVHELLMLLGAGLLGALARGWKPQPGPSLLLPFGLFLPATAMPLPSLGLSALFVFFLKVGSVLFGSGYVLLAFLRADLVDRWHWLSDVQLLDAIAVGQLTPGPVFTTATFVGYLLARTPGALVATLGIFLPAFLFVALSAPLLPRLRRSRLLGAVLDGVNVASLALMAVVTAQLARTAIVSWWTAALCGVSALLLLRYRVGSVWLILLGAVVGVLLRP